MTRLDRHLMVVLALVAAAGVFLWQAPAPAVGTANSRLDRLPTQLGSWRGRAEDLDALLPLDTRSLESVSRVYEDGRRRLWLRLDHYTGENGPDKRPALDTLVASRGASRSVRDTIALPVGDGTTLPATRVSVRLQGHPITAWYWYHLEGRVVGDEYSLRFWLGRNAVLRRPEPLLLVRIATADGEAPTDFIHALLVQLRQRGDLAEGK